jgi:hypothetical protein
LEDFPGLELGELDMGRGALDLDFGPGRHPSREDLRAAVERAGITLIRVEERR